MIVNLKSTSEFSRNVLILMTGTVVAQAIPIAISPILTRIYTPEEFGLFALFFAILSILSVLANARYESAVMLPKKEEDALHLIALGIIINSIFSSMILLVVVLFNAPITKALGNDEIAIWLYFIPIALFFTGLFNILTSMNNRQKNYKDIATATITKSIVMAVIQLSIGLVKNGASGLISGQIVAQFFANIKLFKNVIKEKKMIFSIKRLKIIALALKYKKFPIFSLPSAFSNVLSGHLSNILISSFYSVATLGFYSLVQRVLGIPSALIGKSIGQVYYEEGTRERKNSGLATNTFNATFKKLIIIAFPSFLLLFFIVEELFAFVFGEEWRVAGRYAQIVVPMFGISFIVSSLSSTYDMFECLKVELVWQIVLLVGSITIVMLSNFMEIAFENLLIALSTYILIMQLISLYIIKKIASQKVKENE
jgi:O-antigen/teichoic acid export membrane protein